MGKGTKESNARDRRVSEDVRLRANASLNGETGSFSPPAQASKLFNSGLERDALPGQISSGRKFRGIVQSKDGWPKLVFEPELSVKGPVKIDSSQKKKRKKREIDI